MSVLNFGSVNIDLSFRVDHIVRPGETLSAEAVEKHAGGKGFNQSMALARAGVPVCHAGCVGPDGDFLLDQLREAGADVSLIRRTETQTGTALIQVDRSGANSILLYPGANGEVEEDYVNYVLDRFGPGDVLLLQNEISAMPYILEQAAARGMRIAWNPSPMNDSVTPELLEKADWLLLNEVEAAAVSGEADPLCCAAAVAARYPKACVVVTLGAEGVMLCAPGRTAAHGSYRVKALDTTGAGDTFTGYFLASLLRGEGEERALELASRAAALSVTRRGAAESIPTPEEVEALEAPCGPAPGAA